MSAVARCFRPFASRALSQKLPLAAARRVSPAMGFPRGSIRSFSQSPFSAIPSQFALRMAIEAFIDALES